MAGRPPLPIGTHGEISKPVKMDSGSYEVRCYYRDVDGRTRLVSARGATGAKATAALREALRDRKRRHTHTQELTAESPLSALVERWIETLEPKRRSVTGTRHGSLADSTVDRYIEICRDIIIPDQGGVKLRELNTQLVDNYLASRSTRVREVRGRLSQVCALGVRWGLLEYNPVRETEVPARSRSDKRTLTPEDVQTLLERARLWQARKPGQGGPTRGVDILEIVTLLIATGERIGEVLALRWEDVENIDDRSQPCAVTIAGTVDDAGIRQPLPKSEHGFRRLLLPEYGRRALLSQRERGLPFDLIFPTRNGTPKHRRNIARHWREIRGEDFSWVTSRTFRKTAGTAIEREFGADVAAAQLGHSSPDITRRHYIDRAIQAPDTRAALDRFDPFPMDKRCVGGHLRVVGDDDT